MSNLLQYSLTFAGIPFVNDKSPVVRIDPPRPSKYLDEDSFSPRDQQPLPDLVDELNRLLPFQYLQDFTLPNSYAGRSLGHLASETDPDPQPNSQLKIGDWYYPTGAGRWSAIRMLATSSMVKAMLEAVQPSMRGTLSVKQVPIAGTQNSTYLVETEMYLLPPRPLGELAGKFDGLYLVTLVDERYYFQGTPVSLHPTAITTWNEFIDEVATNLGITISVTTIDEVYGQPEPDSQLWCNFENCAVLLDSIAYNLGRTVVRNLDGTYTLETPAESEAAALQNRSNISPLNRVAGGEMFYDGTAQLPVGDLRPTKNAVIPQEVIVTFPKYVYGDDPVPHFLNSRYPNKRPSAWFEDSYGEVWAVKVSIQSGIVTDGQVVSGSTLQIVNGSTVSSISASGNFIGGGGVSGLVGVSQTTLRNTAKALYFDESTAYSGQAPINSSGLTALALQLADDLYGTKTTVALDEAYPGIYTWAPEGIHDLIWTYSERARMARTRVMRTEWNSYPYEFQHAGPGLSGTIVPKGVGGQSVAQSWRSAPVSGTYDSSGNIISGSLAATPISELSSGNNFVVLHTNSGFISGYRWKGKVDDEIMLMEGTSGQHSVSIVYRGYDGTLQRAHASGSLIYQLPPAVYGVNTVTVESGLGIYPGLHTSGGIQEVIIGPPLGGIFRAKVTNVGDFNGHSYVEVYPTGQGTFAVLAGGRVGAAQYSKNGDFASGGSSIANVHDIAGLISGQIVTQLNSGGMGIASGTTVTTVSSGTVGLSKQLLYGGSGGQQVKFGALTPAYERNSRPQPIDTILWLKPSFKSPTVTEFEFDQDTEPFWAQLTSRSVTAYSWQEVVIQGLPGSETNFSNFVAGGRGRTGYAADSRLSEAINATQTTILLEDGSVFPQTPNTIYTISVNSEEMLVVGGWGTAELTVERGWNYTTAASHVQYSYVLWRQNAAYDANLLTKDVPPTIVAEVGTYVLICPSAWSPGINNRIIPGLPYGPIWQFYWTETPITATISTSAGAAGVTVLRDSISAAALEMEVGSFTSVFPWQGPRFYVRIDNEVICVTDPTYGTTGELDTTIGSTGGVGTITWTGAIPSYPFYAKVYNEIVLLTSETGDATRGMFGTTACTHGRGSICQPLNKWIITRGAQNTIAAAHTAGVTVTQVNPPYAWSQALETANGQFNGGGSLGGTMNLNPAYEMNENWLVPTGTHVRLWRGYDDVGLHGREWTFEYCCKESLSSSVFADLISDVCCDAIIDSSSSSSTTPSADLDSQFCCVLDYCCGGNVETKKATTLPPATYNNYPITGADLHMITPTGPVIMTGFQEEGSQGNIEGRHFKLANMAQPPAVGSAADTITLLSNSSDSTGSNQFQSTGANRPRIVQPGETINLKYKGGKWTETEYSPVSKYTLTGSIPNGGGSSTNNGIAMRYILSGNPISGVVVQEYNPIHFNISGVSSGFGQIALASGGVGSGYLGNFSVLSGSIASGVVAWAHLSSGAVNSGHVANNAINSGNISSGVVAWPHLASGAVRSGHIGNFAVVSGSVASGQIGQFHLSSGAVNSGHIGNSAVVSGSFASGQIAAAHISSGTIVGRSGIIVDHDATNITIGFSGLQICGAKISYAPLSGSPQGIGAGVSGTLVSMSYVEWNSGMTTTTAHKIGVDVSGKYIAIVNMKVCWLSGVIQASGSFVAFSLVRE